MKFTTRKALLEHLHGMLALQQEAVKTNFQPLDTTSLAWKQDADSWSIRECLEHLNIYARYYGLQMRLRTGDLPSQTGGRHERFRSGWFGSWIIKSLGPETGKKYKTLSRYQPHFGQPDANPIQEFLLHLEEITVLLERAERLNLNRIRIPVQFFPLITLNLGDSLHFMLLHQARHIAQAQHAMQQTDFPTLVAN